MRPQSARGLFGFLNQFPCTGQAQLADLVAGDHPCQHLHAAIHVKRVDLGERAVLADILLDQQLVVRKRSNLRRVGDAKHLMPPGRLVQPGREAMEQVISLQKRYLSQSDTFSAQD